MVFDSSIYHFSLKSNIWSINYFLFFWNDLFGSNSSSNDACYWEEWLDWFIGYFFILSGIAMAVCFYTFFPHIFYFLFNLHCLTFLRHFSNHTGYLNWRLIKTVNFIEFAFLHVWLNFDHNFFFFQTTNLIKDFPYLRLLHLWKNLYYLWLRDVVLQEP